MVHLPITPLRNMQNKNYWFKSPLKDKASPCVKWDLGENVSRTHSGDRSTVEWPLNSKTALFIWSLIDKAVISIHSLPCPMEQIFVWPLSFFLILFFYVSQKHMWHHYVTQEASPDFCN